MSRLPRITAKDLTRAVEKLGFVYARQKGSHAVFKHQDGRRTTISIHPGKIIGPGLLRKIIDKDLEISKEGFVKVLRK